MGTVEDATLPNHLVSSPLDLVVQLGCINTQQENLLKQSCPARLVDCGEKMTQQQKQFQEQLVFPSFLPEQLPLLVYHII